MPTLRLLIDPALDGPANMARDEALLDAVSRGDSPPTLRFYAWEPATISLGYFQEFAEVRHLSPPAGELAVVRRTTGGGAILHDLELTYSLTVPADHPWLARGPNSLYELVHRAIIHAVGGSARLAACNGAAGVRCDQAAQRGPFFCFARRHALDVVVADPASPSGWAKLAGSAQRRTRAAVLQHGSLILQSRFEQQPCATWAALGGPSDHREAAAHVVQAMKATASCELGPGEWTSAERILSDDYNRKYARAEWTQRR